MKTALTIGPEAKAKVTVINSSNRCKQGWRRVANYLGISGFRFSKVLITYCIQKSKLCVHRSSIEIQFLGFEKLHIANRYNDMKHAEGKLY